MNGNRASGLKKGYSGPSLHGSNVPDQKGITTKGDFRQASHTMQKMYKLAPFCISVICITTGSTSGSFWYVTCVVLIGNFQFFRHFHIFMFEHFSLLSRLFRVPLICAAGHSEQFNMYFVCVLPFCASVLIFF